MHIFWSNPAKVRPIGKSSEFLIVCSLNKDQNLSMWVILAEKHVSFISCMVYFIISWVVCGNLICVTYLCATNKDWNFDWKWTCIGLDPS
jgi:hypothetical protein